MWRKERTATTLYPANTLIRNLSFALRCLCQQRICNWNSDREGKAAYLGAVEVIILDDSAIYHTILHFRLSRACVWGYPQSKPSNYWAE